MKLMSSVLFLTLFTGCIHNKNNHKPDIDRLLTSNDVNKSIIEMDNYLGVLCSYGDEMDKLNEYQQNFYFNQNLEREINNGGFEQYFFNSSGDYADETIKSLKAIGADKTSKLLEKAINQFPGGNVPKDREERQKQLEKIGHQGGMIFNDLDNRFYDYEDDLNTLNMEYMRKHKDKF